MTRHGRCLAFALLACLVPAFAAAQRGDADVIAIVDATVLMAFHSDFSSRRLTDPPLPSTGTSSRAASC
jgi:hypothetical protein